MCFLYCSQIQKFVTIILRLSQGYDACFSLKLQLHAATTELQDLWKQQVPAMHALLYTTLSCITTQL